MPLYPNVNQPAEEAPVLPRTFPPICVLGEGFVRLVDHMGGDLSVIRAARVSYNADWRLDDPANPHDEKSDTRLIHYLMRNRHTSPFEAVTFTFEVKAPIFIFRQWQRHRTWSYNEVSARYTELDEGYYVPAPGVIGIQATGNKQCRDITQSVSPEQEHAAKVMRDACERSTRTYHALLKQGVPRELARSVLPVAAYSRMFATVNLHNLFGFLRLRLHPHAQWEIRQYAEALLTLATHVAPVSTTAFLLYSKPEVS